MVNEAYREGIGREDSFEYLDPEKRTLLYEYAALRRKRNLIETQESGSDRPRDNKLQDESEKDYSKLEEIGKQLDKFGISQYEIDRFDREQFAALLVQKALGDKTNFDVRSYDLLTSEEQEKFQPEMGIGILGPEGYKKAQNRVKVIESMFNKFKPRQERRTGDEGNPGVEAHYDDIDQRDEDGR